tara:strand:+ start:1721 stop:2329 length:609 start_codon:yes stop_codon:yes gene_type:complete
MLKYNITLKDYIIAGLIIFLLWFVQCGSSKEKTTTTVEIPAKEVTIEKPSDIVYLPSQPQIIKIAGKEIRTENPVNKQMLTELIEAQRKGDSVDVLNKYISAIEEKEQIRTFEQDGVKVDVKSKTRGDLLEQSVKIKIEKQTVQVPIQKDKFGFLGSASYRQHLVIPKPIIEIGAGIRIKKISLLGNINTNKEVGITLIKEF